MNNCPQNQAGELCFAGANCIDEITIGLALGDLSDVVTTTETVAASDTTWTVTINGSQYKIPMLAI